MKSRGLQKQQSVEIRKNAEQFQGEIKAGISFKTFSSLPGYRAGFVILGTYLSQGLNTIEKIIAHWAPSTENDTESYIAHVERWSGVPRNKELTARDGSEYILIVAAMSYVENGQNADISAIQAGFKLQTKIKIQ